jgi:hypothetical protein
MKKYLLALILFSFSAGARPGPFQAQFDHPTREAREPEGTAWAWEKGNETQLVYVFKQRRTLAQLQDYLRKSMPAGVHPSEETRTQVGGYPAVIWGGLNDDGVPFVVLMVSTPKQSFLCGSVTYDTAHNREFVRSFKIGKP